jgi:superfamily II DNA/RNA helicase
MTIATKEKIRKKRKLNFKGWHSTDQDEVERRRQRGETEAMIVRALDSDAGLFGDYFVHSEGGSRAYHVELRSLSLQVNSCDCPDFRVNRLCTCKHIEGVICEIQQEKKQVEELSTIEIYVDFSEQDKVRILWPKQTEDRVKKLLDPFFSADASLIAKPLDVVPTLLRLVKQLNDSSEQVIRVSSLLEPWLEQKRGKNLRESARAAFLKDLEENKRDLDLLKMPLYPYQEEGMLHLAFTERAMLGDEMGLGKTIQAIAACALLKELKGIERVLVVTPASLKTEWEEQITKFTSLPAQIIQGNRSERLNQYRQSSFFYLANYEQIRNDVDEVQEILAPQVIILDEAQRVKNWQTKTAQAVKALKSPYVFILTGTPIENRIDEIYSLMQVVDSNVFGPLFRFNREFYELDERGKPVAYKNLHELHSRLRPVLLRRRKSDVEDQLPERMVNNYFVPMHDEQRTRYEEYNAGVARLMVLAKSRPLKKEEMDRLQRSLACMRMLCDTPYILDQECTVCPKLEELEEILGEIAAKPTNKVIIFSEWERMLSLVKGLAEKLNLPYAFHSGSVKQEKRREEINRFKNDPDCRLFLSTDSGSTGLNLQVANVVIHMDLPWNPAKWEQRIARAWRKHQTRAVQVINLITEESIEHRMLSTLSQKQELADSVLDGKGGVETMPLPSSRMTLLSTLAESLGSAVTCLEEEKLVEPRAFGSEEMKQELKTKLAQELQLLECYTNTEGKEVFFLVVSEYSKNVIETIKELTKICQAQVEVLDKKQYEAMKRLSVSGIIQIKKEKCQELFRSPLLQETRDTERLHNLKKAQARFEEVERKEKMTKVLANNGFEKEALAPAIEAVTMASEALRKLDEKLAQAGKILRVRLEEEESFPEGLKAAYTYLDRCHEKMMQISLSS